MENLMFSPAAGIAMSKWTTGLSSYTQSNCQVSLTSDGYRIYRPPNLTVADNGNTMYGGLKLINSSGSGVHIYNSSTDNIFNLIKGHKYRIMFHVKGKSSNPFSDFGWSNQMGWGGGGLNPTPSALSSHGISSNFNGEEDCFYEFTINDDIVKTCTTSYSYATQGNNYLSYNHFAVGFTYASTGTLGTDLYITNLRMYDITDGKNFQIFKTGIISTAGIIERDQNLTSLNKSGELLVNNFYEY